MRLAFLLLLATNIAVFVWGTYFHPSGSTEARPPAGGNLILLDPDQGR